MTNYVTVRVQLKDSFKEVNVNDSGAVCFVCQAGSPVLATLLDQYGNALANPLQMTSGLMLFQYDAAATGQTAGLDFFGMTAKGHWFEYTTAAELAGLTALVNPSGPNEIRIDTSVKRCRMKIPFAIGNTGPAGACAAATEFKIGLALPAQAAVLDRLHGMGILMVTAQASKTISFGILSTENGGVAAGFINGTSIGPTAPTLFTIGTNGSFFSSNAPYGTDTETSSALNGLDLSLTLSSGTTTGAGYIIAPYQLL